MKFSIIICAYNGEETLFRCLDALKGIDYPKDDYEIIAVDNASTDRTFRILTSYDIRVIGCRKYSEFQDVMNTGASNSEYEHLLFVNQRTVVKKNILKKIEEINYSPLIAGELNIDKYRSGHDTLVYLLNSKMYNPHFPQKKFAEQLWITKKNYYKTYKNNTLLFIEKTLLNKLYQSGLNFGTNEDDLYRKIVFVHKQKILSHTAIDVEYISEYKAKTNRDIVAHGYRWARKNLSKFNLFSFTYYLFHIMIIMIAVMYPDISLAVFAGLYIIFLIYLAESKKDFWIIFKTAPGEMIRFYSGTLKYLTGRT